MRFAGASGELRFELQPGERRLLVDGKPAALGGRAFDVLTALASRPDHLLTKSELLDLVWPGLVVEEANLQVQIANLRKVLGGDVIATVPGRGYRFVGVVKTSAEPSPGTGPSAAASAGAATVASKSPASAASKDTAVAAGSAPAVSPPTATRPAAPQLFGRADDLARLRELLHTGTCVTLVGTSGVGKTSLARAAVAHWSGRTVWVDLAPLARGSQVAGAIARALAVQSSDDDAASHLAGALQEAAQTGSVLLVLDNAEHVIESCADVAASLTATPGVCLLVTSQMPLNIAGERVQRLEPLALDDDDALALLVDRIAAADHRFVATPARQPLLRAICSHLDGLPLALEMAAARVPIMGLQGVHDALTQRFALLTRGHRDAAERHRTLRNALEWSYRLLSPSEQRLFRALGVFAGGFTLDLAAALISDEAETRWDVVDGLASLVDRSLVVASADDPPRYRLLETMRAFALEELARASGDPGAEESEEHRARRRHATAVLAAFPPERSLSGSGATSWLAEMENAREAIAWARTHDLAAAVKLSVRVGSWTTFSVWRLEATAWLCSLRTEMEAEAGKALPVELQAAWWTDFSRLIAIRGDADGAQAARHALALWQSLQNAAKVMFASVVWVRSLKTPGAELDAACDALEQAAAALESPRPHDRLVLQGARAHAALTRSDHDALLTAREAEARIAHEMKWQNAMDAADSNVVSALNKLGRYAQAVDLGTALLARIDRDSPDSGNLPWALTGLFDALVGMGRLEDARALVTRMCAVCRRFRSAVDVPLLPLLTVRQQRFEATAQLVGYARRIIDKYQATLEPDERVALVSSMQAASHALGADRAEALERHGATLDDDAAAALAAAPPSSR